MIILTRWKGSSDNLHFYKNNFKKAILIVKYSRKQIEIRKMTLSGVNNEVN